MILRDYVLVLVLLEGKDNGTLEGEGRGKNGRGKEGKGGEEEERKGEA